MSKIDQLNRAKSLLNQALSLMSSIFPNDKDAGDARQYIRKAMSSLDGVMVKEASQKSMKQNQFEQWWGTIQSGTSAVANSGMTQQAYARSLSALNAMISEEQKKLNALEASAKKFELPSIQEKESDIEIMND